MQAQLTPLTGSKASASVLVGARRSAHLGLLQADNVNSMFRVTPCPPHPPAPSLDTPRPSARPTGPS